MYLNQYTSIVIGSYVTNEMRAHMFRKSLNSLIETTKHLPVEIIVVDNGSDTYLSGWLQGMALGKGIATYVYNSENLHFGIARNQGIAIAKGRFLCIADNDILYHTGWLDACLSVLEWYPSKKIWATPIQYPTPVMVKRYSLGELSVGDMNYHLNSRAGSNCFVMRRSDFDSIGGFMAHRIAGSKWNDAAVRAGFVGAVTPNNMVDDLGLRKGYNLKEPIAIKRTLLNGDEVYFNEDEYRIHHPDKTYYERS